MKRRALAGATIAVAAGMLAGRLLGFVRELLLARVFGVSAAMDALVVALSLPESLNNILIGGPLTMAVIPVLSSFSDETQAERFAQLVTTLLWIGGAVGLAMATLGGTFAPQIVTLTTPGLSESTRALAISCTRVTLLAVPFTVLAYIALPAVQAKQRFALPSVATAAFNVTVILSIVIFAARYGVLAVAVGAATATAVRFFIVQYGLWRVGYRPVAGAWDSNLTRVSLLLLPAVGAFAVRDVNLFVDRYFASLLAPGSIAALNYAERLTQMPLGLVAGTAASAVFPFLAESSAHRDWKVTADYVTSGLRFTLALLVPTALAIGFMAEPVTAIVFQRGAFTNADVVLTARALALYAIGLPFQGVSAVLVLVFYAVERPRAPLVIALFTIVFHAALNAALISRLGYLGIAVSSSLGFIAQALLLMHFVGALPSVRHETTWQQEGLRLAAATALAASGFYLTTRWVTWPAAVANLQLVVQLFVPAAVGIALYILGLAFLFPALRSPYVLMHALAGSTRR